ncbi:precorrin-3B synthase [Celeribacter indicus]|uniref:Precorrin-3B synthase n=1 Tax=Celeribacter indicus TaxID=1208324 RepID=A0A0B5DWV5_9RHOB|nr:precorrin-3B synthase [Celeribacter indicus]AJE45206.1 precorrin-3B synthase [Celeribacter indicus]SDX45298.1 precorrin-3B synthase [Celeribacter indicus]
MSDPVIRGWCPGALRPMRSGDGLVVRLRLPLGRMGPEQALGIAGLSRRHGNGRIDLSARANLQLRGVSEDSHPPLIAALSEMGLIDASPEAEARRNILITPFWRAGDDSEAVARDLAQALRADDAPALSGKFGFAVDCGAQPVLGTVAADIRIERAGEGLICRADGMETGRPVTRKTAARAALDLAEWFVTSGGVQDNRGRMARHLAQGARPPAPWTHVPRGAGRQPPAPGPCEGGVLVALEFGRMEADLLTSLAEFGALRLTPWRMLLIEGATTVPELPGLIASPSDPRLRIDACTGAPDCPQALAATRPLARALAPSLPPEAHLHVSGCTKGCARPAPSDMTLVATGDDRFDLVLDGRAEDPPARRALSQNELLAGSALLKKDL